MTRIRRMALGISSWVVWLASPGCKEWAEGLEREVAFIESDWRAMGWALGGVRVLFDRREAPLRSLAELPAVAKSFHDKRVNQTFYLYLLSVFLVMFWVAMLCIGRAATWLPGGWILLYAPLSVAYRAYACRPREFPESPDLLQIADYYRAELKRDTIVKLELFYAPALAVQLFIFNGHEPHDLATLLVILVPVWMVSYLPVRFWRRRIANLDALLAEAR